MHTHKIFIDRIAVSMTSLRSARTDLATAPKPHDRVTFKTHIDLCDELISRVDEIDRNLRRLTSTAHQKLNDGTLAPE